MAQPSGVRSLLTALLVGTATGALFLATPGFRPPELVVFVLFTPTFLAYGVATVMLYKRFARREGGAA